MKLIIAGSRTFDKIDSLTIAGLLSQFIPDWPNIIKERVVGGARGIDNAGENFARSVGIPFKLFPAQWGEFGKAAGPIRNAAMATYADALLLIHGNSCGSLNMREQMKELNKPIYEVLLSASSAL